MQSVLRGTNIPKGDTLLNNILGRYPGPKIRADEVVLGALVVGLESLLDGVAGEPASSITRASINQPHCTPKPY